MYLLEKILQTETFSGLFWETHIQKFINSGIIALLSNAQIIDYLNEKIQFEKIIF